ncbi:MAG: PQQ-binding-like beta-propeller repeat protein [Candidatus Nealsonbacteria bacterium]|nr:PQQ-binding-like beta-propeller repeat protein [Candidatus Nealsonbacteria bacterium]
MNLKDGTLQATYRQEGRVTAPAVAGKQLFVGTDHGLKCVDITTRKVEWHFADAGAVNFPPVTAGGTVFISGSANKEVFALDATTGTIRWRYKPDDGHSARVRTPLTVVGDALVFGCERRLHCVDIGTGRTRWLASTGGTLWNVPCASDGVVYVNSKHIEGFSSATGERVWQHKHKGDLGSAPVVSGKRLFVVKERGPVAMDLTREDHVLWKRRGLWKKPGQENPGRERPAAASDVVLFPVDYLIFALDCRTGKEKWKLNLGRGVKRVFVVGERCYGIDYLGRVACAEVTSGRQLWRWYRDREDDKPACDYMYVPGEPALSDGALFIATNAWQHN